MQDIMLWNAVLTLAVGAFLWWIRSINNDINKLREDLKDHALSDEIGRASCRERV